ncbi:MAG: sulfite exporter TauE/SafE family protein [Paludibacteraceae bacterium]|nr:sulfite exporter TauE/SafE family protein [Paludibacteraceae bacterium]
MEFLLSTIQNNTSPFLVAFLLGLFINISPCPLCTNITTLAFLGKDLGNKRKLLRNSSLYVLGKISAYTILATTLYFIADKLKIRNLFESYGEKILGIILIIAGILLLDVIKFHKHNENCNHKHFSPQNYFSRKGAFWLGVAFALAFCPYSGVVYFGMLLPLSVESAWGLVLPIIFSIGSILPILIIIGLLSYSSFSIKSLQNRLNAINIYLQRICAIIFLLVGIYICLSSFGFLEHQH